MCRDNLKKYLAISPRTFFSERCFLLRFKDENQEIQDRFKVKIFFRERVLLFKDKSQDLHFGPSVPQILKRPKVCCWRKKIVNHWCKHYVNATFLANTANQLHVRIFYKFCKDFLPALQSTFIQMKEKTKTMSA